MYSKYSFRNGRLIKGAFVALQRTIVFNLWNEDSNWVYDSVDSSLFTPNCLFIPQCFEENEPEYEVYLPVIRKSCEDLKINFDLLSVDDIKDLVWFIILHKKIGG